MRKQTENLGATIVEHIRERMVYDDAWERLPNGFCYWIGNHRQEVTYNGPFDTADETGKQGWTVQIRTDYLQRKEDAQSTGLPALNDLAKSLCFSGIVIAEDGSTCSLGASGFVHEGNQAWVTLPLLQSATHQFLQCLQWPEPIPELASVWDAYQTTPPSPGAPEMAQTLQEQVAALFKNVTTDTPSFVKDEIQNLVATFQSPPCVLCSGDDDGLTAEFPFLDRTQLLSVKENHHSEWGKGFMIQLRLPFSNPAAETIAMSQNLSRHEVEATNQGMCFGPWLNDVSTGNTLSACHFIPISYLSPNLLTNYVNYFVARARWVDEIMNNADWSESFATAATATAARVKQSALRLRDNPETAAEIHREMNLDTDAADPIFRTLSDTTGPLTDPVTINPDFFSGAIQTTLFAYGIFNPMGPTWNFVMLSEHPKHEFLCLTHRMLNPFEQHQQVIATIDTADSDILNRVVKAAFQINGNDDGTLLDDPPTWVIAASEPNAGLAKSALNAHFLGTGFQDFGTIVESFQEFPGNPWDRASKSMKASLGAANKHSFINRVFRRNRKTPSATFEEWWRIVSDETHLETELPNMTIGWEGALNFQSGGDPSNLEAFDSILDMRGLVNALIEARALGCDGELLNKYLRSRA